MIAPTEKLTVTLGAGRTKPMGSRVDAAALPDVLRHQLPEHESWFCMSVFDGDRRANARWLSAAGIALDIDYHDADGSHAKAPTDAHAAAENAWDGDDLPGSFSYLTPRGFRVVFLFKAQASDRTSYELAIQGARRMTEEALAP